MSAVSWIKMYAVAFVLFLALDMAWLGFVAKGFYGRSMSPIVNLGVRWPVAGLFYAVYVAGILIFGLRPALADGSVRAAALWGALFGFFTYATYDLTNLATVKDWPGTLVVVDMLWGTVLSATVSTVTFLVFDRLL